MWWRRGCVGELSSAAGEAEEEWGPEAGGGSLFALCPALSPSQTFLEPYCGPGLCQDSGGRPFYPRGRFLFG